MFLGTKTKIIATVGPSCSSISKIEKMIKLGVDIFRLNFSHGDFKSHELSIKNIRTVSQKLNNNIAILADLPGPKIRLGIIKQGKIFLKKGQEIILTARNIKSSLEIIPIEYKELPKYVKEDEIISINDGQISLKVKNIKDKDIICNVIEGGEISSKKGINLPNTHLPIPALTHYDKKVIQFAAKQKVDWFALSFVTSPKDIIMCKKFISKCNSKIPVIAKLEKYEVFNCLDEIINISDGIMVARGDLGVEIPIEEVPKHQKQIIMKCNALGKPVITATQMLESMIKSYRPTRAEVTDVANAVLDGTDAVMLSGETSVGDYPLQAVKMMDKIASTTESQFEEQLKKKIDINNCFDSALSVAASAEMLSDCINAKAIICFTESGTTPARVSRFRPKCSIISYSANPDTRRKINLYWGVYSKEIPAEFFEKQKEMNLESLIEWVIKDLIKKRIIKKKDKLVIVAGVPISHPNITNVLRVVTV